VNIEAYISSGILEAYALGELTEKERQEVELNLAQFPALKQELAQIEEAQERLLTKASVQPRPVVKSELFAKLDARPGESNVVTMPPGSRVVGYWKLAAAAAITLALISSYLAYDYWNKWKNTESSLSELIAQNQQVAEDYNRVDLRLDEIEKELDVVNNPEFNRIIMKGTPNAPSALASVYWNESTKEVYLSIREMKALSLENQYQLWAIVDGKPVDAGVFDGNFSGLLKMKDITPGASTFAVTVEPRGGSVSPSLNTIQVVGNLVKG